MDSQCNIYDDRLNVKTEPLHILIHYFLNKYQAKQIPPGFSGHYNVLKYIKNQVNYDSQFRIKL